MGDSLDQESTDAVGLYAAVHADRYFVLQTKHWTVSPDQLMHLLWSGLLRRDGIEHLSVSPQARLAKFPAFPRRRHVHVIHRRYCVVSVDLPLSLSNEKHTIGPGISTHPVYAASMGKCFDGKVRERTKFSKLKTITMGAVVVVGKLKQGRKEV